MAKNIIMPMLGMTQDTGIINKWHKKEGDKIGADEILFEVETDKTTMEIEAGSDGYVYKILFQEGETVPVGDTIAIISETFEGISFSSMEFKTSGVIFLFNLE